MNILIVGPSWIGDMVMSQSLYIKLKQQMPNANIDVLAPSWCAPLLSRMPEVNRIIDMPLGHGQFELLTRLRLARGLRGQYDHAFVLPTSAKSALIPWLAKIPKRTGWKGEMRYGLLNDIRPDRRLFQYMSERYIALAYPKHKMTKPNSLGDFDKLPRPSLISSEEHRKDARAKFNLNSDRRIVGLCPGAEYGPAKQWPTEHYAAVAEELLKAGYQVWLFGSPKDEDVCDEIKNLISSERQIHVQNLAGKTSIVEAIDLLACCESVVSNDSGLMHVAAAVGCRIVGVYGSTSPDYTPPLALKKHIIHTDIECRPCFKKECPLGHLKCLKDLAPELVLDALRGSI